MAGPPRPRVSAPPSRAADHGEAPGGVKQAEGAAVLGAGDTIGDEAEHQRRQRPRHGKPHHPEEEHAPQLIGESCEP